MNDTSLHGGEGCGFLPWESTGADFDQDTLAALMTAKIHGQPPNMGYGPPKYPSTMSNMTRIQKRSFKRAFARSQRDGAAWYKGLCMTPSDFPKHMPQPKHPSPSRPAGVPNPHDSKRSPTHRLNIVQYNVGGLSTHKLEELKTWGSHICADILVLLETTWSFTSEWSDDTWHAIHSGSAADRADGILVLIRTGIIQASQIGSAALIAGRLLHVRMHFRQRACDLICCYNYMDDRTTARLHQRASFWQTLDTCLGTIPNRNSMLIAGDMNCSASMDGPHVGTGMFTWHGHQCKGPQHRDMTTFHALLRKFHLTILNGWNAKLGPTFHNGLMVSRIDFFITRTAEADGFSRDVKYLHSADIVPLAGATHVPLMCCIKKFQFSYRSKQSHGFTYQQRLRCRLDWQRGSATWDCRQVVCDNTATHRDPVQTFHDQLGERFHYFYPKNETLPRTPKPSHEDIIQQKWYYHRQVKNNQSLTLPAIFHVWKCRSKCSQLTREHRRLTKTFKRQRFFDLLTAVQGAAERHDSFEVHQIINKFTPKQPKKKIQLKNADGSPASPSEALQLTKAFVERIWAGADVVHLGNRDPPGVPISVADIEFELQRLPHNKSVAPPFLPALVVKHHASTIAPWIHQLLTQWWTTSDPYIPDLWKRAWVTLIPKPTKSPSKVENLRCIALQEPLGKCILGALTRKLLAATGATLMSWPQFAFLPHRSTGDAIRRVMDHCNNVRCLIKNQRRSAHQRAAATEFFRCCGGIQIFLDIQRAFDQLPRQQLFEHLDTLHDVPALTTLMAQWHTHTSYCVEQAGESVLVETTRGVRQGCRAAPLLWNCFLDRFFRQLAAQISDQWVRDTLTAFADDIHHGTVFKSHTQLLSDISRIGLILDTLENMGLTLSLEKSFILLEIAGTHSRKIRSSLVKQDGTNCFLEIPRSNGTYSRIPVKKEADYLGTRLSYSNPEQLTFEKRVQCARITYITDFANG